jgi:hypothetical protein
MAFPSEVTYPSETLFPEAFGDWDPAAISHTFEISFVDVSVTTPTWVNMTSRLRAWSVDTGRNSELEMFDVGKAVYRLDNRDRVLDPTNVDSPYYPNVVSNRRVRHRITVDGTTYDVFYGFIDAWGPSWDPWGSGDAVADVRCSDGGKVISPYQMTPANPDVEEYDELMNYYSPTFYYRMGEPEGTKLVSHRKIIKRKHHKRVKRWKTIETKAELGGVSGPAGTYKNTPLLGEPGSIAGDPNTSVKFRRSQSEYAIVGPLDQSDLIDSNRLTLRCRFTPETNSASHALIVGPNYSVAGSNVFFLWVLLTGGVLKLQSSLLFTDGSSSIATGATTLTTNTTWDLGMTWDGTTSRVYVNGVQDGSNTPAAGKILRQGDAGEYLYFGRYIVGPTFMDGWMDEIAIFERALPAVEMLTIKEAASLGFDSQTTDARITSTLAGISPVGWPSTSIQAGARTMSERRTAGVDASELLQEAVEAEGLPAMLFFSKSGVLTYLSSTYRSSAPYNSSTYTFGVSGGDLSYESLELDDSDSFLYNVIVGTRELGESVTVSDSTSISRFGRKVLSVTLPHASAADTSAYVSALLARYKDPMVRIAGFTVDGSDATSLEAALDLDLARQVTVKAQPPGGGGIFSQASFIERRSFSQAGRESPIMAKFSVSPR